MIQEAILAQSTASVRTGVKSSLVKSIGYTPNTKLLEIEFLNGELFQYSNIVVDTYLRFMASESYSKFFKENIKDQYPGKKLN
jgi:hypothetical protein